jgi:general secretion pathway protein B
MSILLEALKKSEQQRQLGQTPTLQTHTGDQSTRADEQFKWVVPVLVAISVGVMGWFGWKQFRVPESGSAPIVEVAAERQEGGTVTTQMTEPKPRTPTESFRAEKSAEKPGMPGGLKLAPQMASDSVAKDSAAKDKTRVNKSFKSFQAKDQVDDKTVDKDTDKQLAQKDSQPGTSRASQTAEPDTNTAKAASQPVEDSKARKTSRVEPHVSEPISYWELPQGIRDNLPEINISVLVFAEQPSDRFLLTDGQRLMEKDELQSGLVLDEIRRDGAIFVYRNYRFLVKG